MAFKSWIQGEKLYAADLNGNFKSPAFMPLHDVSAGDFNSPAFNGDWSRMAIGVIGSSSIKVFKNYGSKLDAFTQIGSRTRANANTPNLTFLGSYFGSMVVKLKFV